jgi:transposase
MRKTREILRQKWQLGRTHRATAASLGTSAGAIGAVLVRAAAAGVSTWADVEALSEEELEARLYGATRAAPEGEREEPDCTWIHRERTRPGVTLQLLHIEYLEKYPGGYQYTAFCDRFREWCARRALVMRHVHVAGDKLFVDYSGKRPSVVDGATGEVTPVELFVAVLGGSNYTYAEVTRTQRGPDWIASHVRALEYFGGVPKALVCDQLKSGVVRACRYEPEIQRTYEDLATHYGTTVLPARPYKPRDKAKVEGTVLIVQRWILARIRNETFNSLAALNARIRDLLVDLNARVMRRYGKSRRELFESTERAALGALPSSRFEYAEWKKATVNIDYHVLFDTHSYSVPYAHVHDEVWVRATAVTVEVLLRNRRIALHARSHARGGFTTLAPHMPSSHRAQAEWTPSRILAWAEETGPAVHAYCAFILEQRRHPEHGFKSCLGIFRLGKRYGRERLDAACARAHRAGSRTYHSVASILDKGLDRVPEQNDGADVAPIAHENVRGPGYYLN